MPTEAPPPGYHRSCHSRTPGEALGSWRLLPAREGGREGGRQGGRGGREGGREVGRREGGGRGGREEGGRKDSCIHKIHVVA